MSSGDIDVSLARNDGKVLYVRWSPFDNIAHIVSAATIAEADAADEQPVLVDFGDLRRSGDLDTLGERLEQHGYGTLADYVAAIERSEGVQSSGADLGARLPALNEVDFEGLDGTEPGLDGEDCYLPADDVGFLNEWEAEEAPAEEFRGYVVIARAMSSDIPSDLFEEFCASLHGGSPGFDGHVNDHVDAVGLPALIAALEARGYTVVTE